MIRTFAPTLIGVALAVNVACTAKAAVITSNLANAFSGSTVVSDNLWVAQSFTTDGTMYAFDSITVSALGLASTSDIEFSLWDNDAIGNNPGNLINILSGPGMPAVFTGYTYLPTASVMLVANTKYWVLARTQLGGDYLWVRTLDTSEVGPGTLGGSLGSADLGVNWGEEGSDEAKFLSVEGTIVPEPSSLVLAVLAIFGMLAHGRRRRCVINSYVF